MVKLINRGTTKWMVYWKNLIKMDDLGVPLFFETPIYTHIYVYIYIYLGGGFQYCFFYVTPFLGK